MRIHNDDIIRPQYILVTKFDEDSARKFRDAAISMSQLDVNRPILIYIDSYGGSVDALASMIETMDEIQNPIITVAIGKAMSCGAILLSHGDIRFCGRHSRIMVHEVSGWTGGDVHDLHADAQEMKRLNEYFMGLLAKNCGLKSYADLRKIIKEQDGRDRYFTAEDAVKFGIVDVIGLPRLNSSILHEISTVPLKSKLKVQVDPLKSKKTIKSTKNAKPQNNPKKSDSKK